eukprot:5301965-Lingulodinium_polyedra.AAC.1
MVIVGLGDIGWTTHSLRRGGATALYERGWAFEDVQLYGRWASSASCREYVRTGMNAVLRLRAAHQPEVWYRMRLLASLGAECFNLEA